jgi:hypothetical protein
LTSALSGYLPLTGGTLTGALGGTTASFSGNLVLSGSDARINGGDSVGRLLLTNSNTTTYIGLYGATHPTLPYIMSFVVNSASALAIASTGAATFSSSVTIEGNGSTIKSGNELRFNRTDNAIYTRMYDAGSGAANGFIFDNTNNEGFHFKNTTTTLMRMNSAGNVGIGTSSPNQNLEVVASGTSTIRVKGNSTTGLDIQNDSGGSYFWNRDNSPVYIATNNTERMRITSTGNVGIGTSSPDQLLHLETAIGGSSGVGTAIHITSGGAGGDQAWIGVNKGTGNGLEFSVENRDIIFNTIATSPFGGSERMRITSAGRLLVGTTDAGTDFTRIATPMAGANGLGIVSTDDASGGGYIAFRNSAFGNIGNISRVGTTNAVAYNTTSDYRLKEDLKEIKGLEKVCAIKVYDFKWKDNIARMDGVIAHELAEVLPYAVHGLKDAEEMQSVDYSKLTPILVKAIQELSAEITILKNK